MVRAYGHIVIQIKNITDIIYIKSSSKKYCRNTWKHYLQFSLRKLRVCIQLHEEQFVILFAISVSKGSEGFSQVLHELYKHAFFTERLPSLIFPLFASSWLTAPGDL